MRSIMVSLLAITLLSACAITEQPQSGDFTTIVPGTDRQRVIEQLGQPPRSQIVNGKPVLDSYACEPGGQIVAVNLSVGWLVTEYILTLGIAGVVDTVRYYNLQQRLNECDVQYGEDGKVSRTSSIHGPIVQSP
jgi:hypothetical protein